MKISFMISFMQIILCFLKLHIGIDSFPYELKFAEIKFKNVMHLY